MKTDWGGLQEILEAQKCGQGPFSLFSLFISGAGAPYLQTPLPSLLQQPLPAPSAPTAKHSPFFPATDTLLYIFLCIFDWREGWAPSTRNESGLGTLFTRSNAASFCCSKSVPASPDIAWIDSYKTLSLKVSFPSQLQTKRIVCCLLQDTLVGNCLSLFMLCKLLTLRKYSVKTNSNQCLAVTSLCWK